MRLEDCALPNLLLPGQYVVSAPLVREGPEEEWVLARDSEAIPTELYDLYRRANYLSFGSAPKFLRTRTTSYSVTSRCCCGA